MTGKLLGLGTFLERRQAVQKTEACPECGKLTYHYEGGHAQSWHDPVCTLNGRWWGEEFEVVRRPDE
jgi:hypothetical protein